MHFNACGRILDGEMRTGGRTGGQGDRMGRAFGRIFTLSVSVYRVCPVENQRKPAETSGT